MNPFQPVTFYSVEDFLEYLPEQEQDIVHVLRKIVMECIPQVREKLSYNVPFYYRNRRICFIWPSSVPWGKVKMQGVQLGFCYGYLLDNRAGYLETGSRKQVSSKTFFRTEEIDLEMVKSFLYEAVDVDKNLKTKAG